MEKYSAISSDSYKRELLRHWKCCFWLPGRSEWGLSKSWFRTRTVLLFGTISPQWYGIGDAVHQAWGLPRRVTVLRLFQCIKTLPATAALNRAGSSRAELPELRLCLVLLKIRRLGRICRHRCHAPRFWLLVRKTSATMVLLTIPASREPQKTYTDFFWPRNTRCC